MKHLIYVHAVIWAEWHQPANQREPYETFGWSSCVYVFCFLIGQALSCSFWLHLRCIGLSPAAYNTCTYPRGNVVLILQANLYPRTTHRETRTQSFKNCNWSQLIASPPVNNKVSICCIKFQFTYVLILSSVFIVCRSVLWWGFRKAIFRSRWSLWTVSKNVLKYTF